MPLIQIVRNPKKIPDNILMKILSMLPKVAAEALSCSEGGKLQPKDIMIEVTEFSPFDTNCKDLHVRVWAHDYPSRAGRNLKKLDEIQHIISSNVWGYITAEVPEASWNVWVLLAKTSYRSDTEA